MRNRSITKKLQLWLRTFHTIRHLQPRQALYFFLRRGIGARRVNPSKDDITRRNIIVPAALQLVHSDADFSTYDFNFLNRAMSFPCNAMNWSPNEVQRLWRYNLHYFDFLRSPTRSLHQKIALIDDWIDNNPQGSEPAWEPYTASLRIVNWCLFFLSLPRHKVSARWLQSLHTQARWLEKNLELHILANHYFENIKAMLFAVLFFDDHDSKHWLAHFQKELIAQLHEQTLPDGGHYERSPQYHCILLEDYLEIYALLQKNSALIEHETLSALSHTINVGLRFLAAIATPDDGIPLFNDSANGAASAPSVIFAKAAQLGFVIEIPQSILIDLPNSGLFGWKSDNDYFLIDCGDIGPAYQPGHTHCDFLSLVLMIDRQWIVVDSGVCEYEPGPMRTYARSTLAHNTITVDDNEQSEVWGEFRVGRRAHSLGATISKKDHSIVFEGAYRGFPRLGGIVHRRRVTLTLNYNGTIQDILIEDAVDGSNRSLHDIKAQVHLHPDLGIKQTRTNTPNEEFIFLKKNQAAVATIKSSYELTTYSDQSWLYSEFGLQQANLMLQMRTRSNFPARLSCHFTINRG